MEVEVIMPSVINQAQKDKYFMISHVKSKKVDLIEVESRIEAGESRMENNGGRLIIGY